MLVGRVVVESWAQLAAHAFLFQQSQPVSLWFSWILGTKGVLTLPLPLSLGPRTKVLAVRDLTL